MLQVLAGNVPVFKIKSTLNPTILFHSMLSSNENQNSERSPVGVKVTDLGLEMILPELENLEKGDHRLSSL